MAERTLCASEVAPASANVLVVDDDRDIARAVALRLAEAGYTPVVASGGGQALELVRGNGLAAIVLDLGMPGIDGYSVLAQLPRDALTAPLPCVVLSAAAAGRALPRALSGGAAYFLEKPYRPEALIAAVRAAIAGRPAARRPAA
jgi:CheY-like chemotaxis protein